MLYSCYISSLSVFRSLLYQHEHHRRVTHLHLDWSDVLVCRSTAGLGQLHRSVSHTNLTQERKIRLYFKSLDLTSVSYVPQIEVMEPVRWTGPKPITPPSISPTSSPSSSSAFSSQWWSCSSPTSPLSTQWKTPTPCQLMVSLLPVKGRWREMSQG